MSESNATSLDEIEAAVLDETQSVAAALRKILVLGGKASSKQLLEWAGQELNGYDSNEGLPDYRILHCALLIDGAAGFTPIQGQRISPLVLPEQLRKHVNETVPLRQGIGAIEKMAEQAKASGHLRLSPQGGAEIAAFLTTRTKSEFSSITEVYWSVSWADLHGIIDRVRTIMAGLVAELRASQPDTRREPKPQAVQQVVNNYFGRRARGVVVNTSMAAIDSQSSIAPAPPEKADSPAWYATKKFWALAVGAATIIAAIPVVLAWWK